MNLVYLGRYNEGEILTGPEKVGKRIFQKYSEENKTVFIEYFFDGKRYGLFKKLFGREEVCCVNGSSVKRAGLISLLGELVKIRPGIIHIISFERFALAAFLYRAFFKTKIIYNVHGLVVHENKIYGYAGGFRNFKDCFAEDIFMRYSDSILLLSKNLKKLLDKYYSVSKSKIKYVKNGVDEEFKYAGLRNNKTLKIVFISDIKRKEKGFDFLKEALEKSDIKIELNAVGNVNPGYEIKFENKLIDFCSYGKMSPSGLADFLKDKDVFISSAEYEPFGMAGAECMSAGLIPVLTSETGAADLISDGINGFVYEYGNSEELLRILTFINDNPDSRKKISAEVSKIYSVLNWNCILKDYKNIYKEILN